MNRILIIPVLLFLIILPSFLSAQESTSDTAYNADNAITIEIVTKGTCVLWDYVLNAEKITATKHPTNGNVPITVFEKVFTADERTEVEKFIGSFQAEPLKEKYIKEKMQGEGSYWFNFRINTLRKKVVVSYEYPAELKSVVDFFNMHLHEKYRIAFE